MAAFGVFGKQHQDMAKTLHTSAGSRMGVHISSIYPKGCCQLCLVANYSLIVRSIRLIHVVNQTGCHQAVPGHFSSLQSLVTVVLCGFISARPCISCPSHQGGEVSQGCHSNWNYPCLLGHWLALLGTLLVTSAAFWVAVLGTSPAQLSEYVLLGDTDHMGRDSYHYQTTLYRSSESMNQSWRQGTLAGEVCWNSLNMQPVHFVKLYKQNLNEATLYQMLEI